MTATEKEPISGPFDQSEEPRGWFASRTSMIALGVVTAICALALIFLTFSMREEIGNIVRTDLDDIQHQMTVFDADVFQFLNETTVDHEHTFDHSDATHMETLRNSFNGIARFITILEEDPTYSFVQDAPGSAEALQRLRRFVDRFIDVVNGSDAAFSAAMHDLHHAANTLPAPVQAIKVETEKVLNSQREDLQREAAAALNDLTYLTVGFVVLVTLIFGALGGLYRASIRVADAQGALRNRVKAIVSSAQDAVVITDEAASILHFNTAAEKLFGFARGDIDQRNAIEVLASVEGRKILLRRMSDLGKEAAQTQKAVFDRFVHSAAKADGSMFPAEVSTSVNHGESGLLFVHFIRDISARLENERELKAARDKALSGEKAKSNFLAVMSHEIRTPLNGLLGTMSLLEETKLDDGQLGYLANMRRSGQLLREHVDDVLDIARFEAGYQPEIVNVDLDALLAEVVENQIHLAAIRENEVSWSWVGEPMSMVRTDPRLLRQVLINLVGNGVKFTLQGQVRIEAELVEPRTGGPMVEIRVRDTGPGIPPEDQARVFKDFERVDSSLTRETSGTGLGLGIARRMTEALRGEIGVASILGKGSTFWLRLPYLAADASDPSGENSPSVPQSIAAPKRVLIVEDNEINRQVLEQMLVSDGHSVVQAVNGRDGVEAARAARYDLILMDVSMPVMDGPTAIGLIRSGDGPNRKTDIVVVTAHVMLREYARFQSLGAEGYLKKPIDRGELREILAGSYEWPDGLDVEPEDDDLPEIDASQLESLLEGLGSDKLGDLLEQFYVENDELLEALRCENINTATVMLAHKFAGSAAIVGAVDLHTRLREFETLAKEESPRAAQVIHAEELARLSYATRSALQEWLQA